ncbi:5-oxoprolinase subunit B family protein [Streptomyces sp. 8L]|uniref:5-oxoprolinase subunit B family protein n=1 Tax=Streptomyces sp. 8L TaxID=2877242 RepID=UPI001CD7DD5F|nr:allophanate hydrolase subunit 1 [Streptomyces sp. 8L]MCA1221045.1 allophanate hydrolase subunit 1 [Streptomyces sp. 8L]
MSVRAVRVGDHALLLELGGSEETAALHAELLRRRAAGALPAVGEIVPAERTVLVDGLAEPARFAADVAGWRLAPADTADSASVDLPVRYDGPDLADVAGMWGVSPKEAALLHAGTSFRVAFCGFSPGFGYLTGLDERYAVRRRATPRTSVPAGSVAVAGPYTGVYPRSSPGGWQLIGTTDAVLWDPEREPPALLAPGTRVRFVAVDA